MVRKTLDQACFLYRPHMCWSPIRWSRCTQYHLSRIGLPDRVEVRLGELPWTKLERNLKVAPERRTDGKSVASTSLQPRGFRKLEEKDHSVNVEAICNAAKKHAGGYSARRIYHACHFHLLQTGCTGCQQTDKHKILHGKLEPCQFDLVLYNHGDLQAWPISRADLESGQRIFILSFVHVQASESLPAFSMVVHPA